MNDLIAARPLSRSSVAQTTIRSARSPGGDEDLLAVEHVLVAVQLRGGADRGRVRAGLRLGDRHRRPTCRRSARAARRSATEAIAELPRPWRGIESSRPTSPQQSSMMPSTVERLEPLRFSPSVRRLAAHAGGARGAFAALVHAVDQRGEHVQLFRVRVLGFVVLARDRPEDLGRDLVRLADQRLELLRCLEIDHHECAFARGLPGVCLDEQGALHDARCAQVAVPALDRVLLDVAVAAEQLHAARSRSACPWRRRGAARSRPRGRSFLPWSARDAARRWRAACPPARSRCRRP